MEGHLTDLSTCQIINKNRFFRKIEYFGKTPPCKTKQSFSFFLGSFLQVKTPVTSEFPEYFFQSVCCMYVT